MSKTPEAKSDAWHVYVLISNDGALTYAGISTDTERRLDEHNGERPGGAKATRRGRPWRVATVYGPFETRGEAQRAELSVKQLKGRSRLEWTPPI